MENFSRQTCFGVEIVLNPIRIDICNVYVEDGFKYQGRFYDVCAMARLKDGKWSIEENELDIIESRLIDDSRDHELPEGVSEFFRSLFLDHVTTFHKENPNAFMEAEIRVLDRHIEAYRQNIEKARRDIDANSTNATLAQQKINALRSEIDSTACAYSELPEVEEEEDNSSGLTTLNITFSDRQKGLDFGGDLW